MKYTIYCDGGCRNNGSADAVGGWGVYIINNDTNVTQTLYGYEHNTTNNKMEITAVIQALKTLPFYTEDITIYSDSQYVVFTITKGWKRKKNIELWAELDKLLANYTNIKLIHTPGHSGIFGNEIADKLCNYAMDIAQKKIY